jgi:hypothetical protein
MKTKCLLLAAVCGGLLAAPLLGQPTIQAVNAGAMINRCLRGSGLATATASQADHQWLRERTTIPLGRCGR